VISLADQLPVGVEADLATDVDESGTTADGDVRVGTGLGKPLWIDQLD